MWLQRKCARLVLAAARTDHRSGGVGGSSKQQQAAASSSKQQQQQQQQRADKQQGSSSATCDGAVPQMNENFTRQIQYNIITKASVRLRDSSLCASAG